MTINHIDVVILMSCFLVVVRRNCLFCIGIFASVTMILTVKYNTMKLSNYKTMAAQLVQIIFNAL